MKKILINTFITTLLTTALFISCSKEKIESKITSDDMSINATAGSDIRSAANTVAQGQVVLYISNGVYSQKFLNVLSGTTVTWVNNDNTAHTVSSDDERFGSSILLPGDTYSYRFVTVGPYPYHCNYHPDMKGLVYVRGEK